MGCEPSNTINGQQNQTQSQANQFIVNYRQFVAKDRGDVCQFYHFSKIISRSATSVVRKIIHRTSKIQRVCKIIPLTKKDNISAMRQVQTLRRLDHPNIVKINQYFLQGSFLYIVLEDIPGKPFINQVISHNGLKLVQIVSVMRQLFSAVQYIHQQNFAHRLINPDNIILAKLQQGFILKLVDFSQCVVKDAPNPPNIPRGKNQSVFEKPQNYKQQKAKGHLDKKDIWGCALILYSLISGKIPKDFYLKKNSYLQQLKIQNKVPLGIDLLQKITTEDPEHRPSASQCLNHQFFNVKRSQDNQKRNFMFKNLLQFNACSRMNSLFFMYASLNLTDFKDKSEYLIQFHNLDKNKDGALDFSEMVQGLQNTFNIPKQKAQLHAHQIFKSLDKNNNGHLDYSQFVMGTMAVNRVMSQQNLKKLFQQIDTNNDGSITQQQLNCVIDGIDSFKILGYSKKQLQFADFRKIMQQMLVKRQKQLQFQ